jgi:transposase
MKGHTYLKIVHSYRMGSKSKHEVIANLGRADILAASGLENIIESLKRYVKEDKQKAEEENKFPDILKMEEKERNNYGYICYKKLWNNYGMKEIVERIQEGLRIRYDLCGIVFSLVVGRLLRPGSKLDYYNHKDTYIGINEDLDLQDIYRTLDIISKNKEQIEEAIFYKSRDLFNMELDVVFYDVTTFYFESQRSDELRDYGFSKDCKINEVQVVMGLLVDKEGKPIGYELYRGNTFDSKTMLKMLKKIKEKFRIEKVVIVADKGMNSKINLKEIKESGLDYIVSARLRSMPDKIQNEILKKEEYMMMEGIEGEKSFSYKIIDYTNVLKTKEEENTSDTESNQKGKTRTSTYIMTEKLICTYSEFRAKKDKKDRERMLEKAKEIVGNNRVSMITQKKGYKKYIKGNKKEGTGKLEIDENKIQEDEQYDGYYVIQSSKLDLSAKEVIANYHNLYKIEESFRVIKTTMKTRPIFHYTPERIEGHFVLCFIAFLLERELEGMLKRKNIDSSPEKIKEAINSLEFTQIEIEKEKYYLKSKQLPLASKILSELRLKQPNNVLSEEQLKQYLEI